MNLYENKIIIGTKQHVNSIFRNDLIVENQIMLFEIMEDDLESNEMKEEVGCVKFAVA